jgi:monoamine oxidase
MNEKTAIVIGAGPAGLTAAYELLERTDVRPMVLEMSEYLGGISRTVNYKGNRIDIGGHRFFSKSDRVMEWWLDKMPLQALPAGASTISYQRQSRRLEIEPSDMDPDTTDRVMLLRQRKSRICFLRSFFEYPLRLSFDTVA